MSLYHCMCGGTAFLQHRLSSSPQTRSSYSGHLFIFFCEMRSLRDWQGVNSKWIKPDMLSVWSKKEPSALDVHIRTASTHLLFGLRHALIIQTTVAAFLIWCSCRVAEIKLFNNSCMQRWTVYFSCVYYHSVSNTTLTVSGNLQSVFEFIFSSEEKPKMGMQYILDSLFRPRHQNLIVSVYLLISKTTNGSS